MKNNKFLKERIKYLDIAKFIGIFCIYLGHFGEQAGYAYNFVFWFHVPLFFFLSGISETFSKDTDFDKACEYYNFKRIDNIDGLKSYILENHAEAKEKHILGKLNSNDNRMKISGYCKDHDNRSRLTEDLVVNKILKEICLINEELNEMQIKIECKMLNKKHVLEITLDLEDLVVVDAKEV